MDFEETVNDFYKLRLHFGKYQMDMGALHVSANILDRLLQLFLRHISCFTLKTKHNQEMPDW